MWSHGRFDELDAFIGKYFIKVRSHDKFDEFGAFRGKYVIKVTSIAALYSEIIVQ